MGGSRRIRLCRAPERGDEGRSIIENSGDVVQRRDDGPSPRDVLSVAGMGNWMSSVRSSSRLVQGGNRFIVPAKHRAGKGSTSRGRPSPGAIRAAD